MIRQHVLLDSDGVLLNWEQGLQTWMAQEHPHLSNPSHYDEHAFELSLRYNISRELGNQLVWDFHNHVEFTRLHPLPRSQQAISKLSQRFHLVVITACGVDQQIQEYRKQNLINCFGDVFEKIICVNRSVDKAVFLKSYPSSYWVEDHATNANMGSDLGHLSFLVDAPYNQHKFVSPGVKRVADLAEAAEIILSQ